MVSTLRVKRIQRTPAHRFRFIFLDPFAVSSRFRTREIFSRIQRCVRRLAVTHGLLVLLFVASSSFCVVAQIGSSQSETEQSAKGAMKRTYEEYLQAWKDKDLNALNHLLSDDYLAINFQGIISTKANEIATAKEDRTYHALSGDVLSVALVRDCAITSGLIEASWKDEHENSQTSTFRFLAVLRKQKGEWKLVATQSTKFNKPPAPGKK